MGRDLGWSKPDLYGAATIGLLLSGLAAYPVGSAIDRGHGRTIMAGASVLAGILLIAWSQVESIAVFYFLLAGIGCLQAAVLTETAFAVVSRRFGAANARGGIVALTLWAGFASTVFIPLIQFLLDHFGGRETLLVRVVAGALDNVQFDNLLLEQTQAPSGKAFRGRREGQRDQFCFRRAVENPPPGGVRVVFAGQHRLEPFLDQLAPGPLDSSDAGVQRRGDPAVAPAFGRIRYVRLQQDARLRQQLGGTLA